MPVLNPRFEIELSVAALKETFSFVNIHQFTVIKSPFNKLANIITITVESDYAALSIIDREVQAKNEPPCFVEIYSIKDAPFAGSRRQRDQKIYKNNFFIFHAIDEETQNATQSNKLQTETKTMTFVLVNPVLHWLQVNHEFVSLCNNVSGYDALKKYEGYLTDKFGKDTFNFMHSAKDPSKYKYEQMLIRSTNDLAVPNQIMNEYKAFDSLGYYYYDSFNFTSLIGDKGLNQSVSTPKTTITNSILTFGDLSALPKIDIYDSNHKDATYRSILESVENIQDISLNFQRDAATVFVQNPNHQESIDTPTTIGDVRPKASKVNSAQNKLLTQNAGRTMYGGETTPILENIKPKHHISIYSPDTDAKAKKRYSQTQQLISNKIKSYVNMTIQECYPDLINLNSLYNIDSTARASFTYLPITIANMFHKQQSRDSALVHSAKVKFINFNI